MIFDNAQTLIVKKCKIVVFYETIKKKYCVKIIIAPNWRNGKITPAFATEL